MHVSRLWTILGCILLGLASRLLPHPPNFTAVNAIALLGACYFGSRWLACATVFFLLILSDWVLGFHSTVPFVYFSVGIAVVMGRQLEACSSSGRVASLSWVSSCIFFLITNFGVWVADTLYPKNAEGLCACYLAALPFFANQVCGDVFYSLLLFSGAYLFQSKQSGLVSLRCADLSASQKYL